MKRTYIITALLINCVFVYFQNTITGTFPWHASQQIKNRNLQLKGESLDSLDKSPHLGHIWENFVLTEFIKEGLVAGKDLFYLKDSNGNEIDFIIEKEGKVYLIEAKHSERPDRSKLNLKRIAPLFETKVTSIVACGIQEQGMINLKDFSAYNPLTATLEW